MGIHDRAWSGFKCVILGKTPLVPMRIEQSIASVSPGVEVSLSSFENYDQAFRFCKENRNVGFFFVLEDCGDAPFHVVFRELSAHYESFGLPAFGVVLHEGEPKAFSERLIAKSPNLLDYVPASALLDVTKAGPSMSRLWSQYVEAFENSVLPNALQKSILSLAEDVEGADSVHFLLRVSSNLASDLNVSWLEGLATKWGPLLSLVAPKSASFIRPHPVLEHFIDLCKPSAFDVHQILTFLKGKEPLCRKVGSLAYLLEQARRNGTLKEVLNEISSANKPGAPKLVKHVAANALRIAEISEDANNLLKVKVSA